MQALRREGSAADSAEIEQRLLLATNCFFLSTCQHSLYSQENVRHH